MYALRMSLFCLCIFLSICLYGQSGDDITIYGFLDGTLPVGIHHNNQEECTGHLSLKDKEIPLEGECRDSSFVLYEFDESSRVIASISGELNEGGYDLAWHSHDHSRSSTIQSIRLEKHLDVIKVYTAKEGEIHDQIFIRPDTREIFIPKFQDKSLRWSSYACPTANYACQVMYGEEKLTLSLADRVVSIGSQLYHWTEDVRIDYALDEGYHFYQSYSLPRLNQKAFDKYLSSALENEANKFQKTFDIDLTDLQPEQRLQYRSYGDFVISLASSEYISGHLHIQDPQTSRSTTYPFTFDRNKKKFVKLREIWKDDFNFSYFLKSLIENQKREVVKGEKGAVKQILKEQTFAHFGLTPNAIVFYTDFHFVYGRRSIYVPYEEIDTFIEDKTLSQYIEKVLRDG